MGMMGQCVAISEGVFGSFVTRKISATLHRNRNNFVALYLIPGAIIGGLSYSFAFRLIMLSKILSLQAFAVGAICGGYLFQY